MKLYIYIYIGVGMGVVVACNVGKSEHRMELDTILKYSYAYNVFQSTDETALSQTERQRLWVSTCKFKHLDSALLNISHPDNHTNLIKIKWFWVFTNELTESCLVTIQVGHMTWVAIQASRCAGRVDRILAVKNPGVSLHPSYKIAGG